MNNVFISFRDYVRKQPALNALGGDFIAEAKRDPRFPNIKAWHELRGYLRGRDAAHETIVAGRAAWQSYRQHLNGGQKKRTRVKR